MLKVFSNALNLPVLKHRAFKVTTSGTPGTAVKLKAPDIACLTLTRSGTTATFTATAPHRLATGQWVDVSGADQAAYNVAKVRITVTSATAFTYVMASDPGASGSGTIIATWTPHAQWAVVVSDSGNNVAGVTLGPDVNADLDTIQPGQSYALPTPNGAKFDLSDWYASSTIASQNLTVLIL